MADRSACVNVGKWRFRISTEERTPQVGLAVSPPAVTTRKPRRGDTNKWDVRVVETGTGKLAKVFFSGSQGDLARSVVGTS